MIDTHEVAWAAGFFDGEGSILWRGNKRQELTLTVAQARVQPLQRFHKAIMNVGSLRGPYQPKNEVGQPYWVVSTHGHGDTQFVVALLWRWLSEPKRSQSHDAMSSATPHYIQRSAMGKGRSILTIAEVEQLRADYLEASKGRQRVPKGWFDIQCTKYNANRHTLAHICKGMGYV